MSERFDDDATDEERAEARRLRFAERAQDLLVRYATAAATPEATRERERMLTAQEARRQRERILLAIERGAPADPEVRRAAFENTRDTESVIVTSRALSWREGRRRPCVLYLGGPPGTGKTVALTRLLLEAPRTARYVQASAVPTRNGFSLNEEEYKQLLRVDVLAVDELGRELKPDVIRDLMLDRWTHGGMTVLAGNGSVDVFKQRYLDGALISRLRLQIDQGLMPVAELRDGDMRAT